MSRRHADAQKEFDQYGEHAPASTGTRTEGTATRCGTPGLTMRAGRRRSGGNA